MVPNYEHHQLSFIIQTKCLIRIEKRVCYYLNKCKTGDHIALCLHCNIASIHCLYGTFSRFLYCSAFPFFVTCTRLRIGGKEGKNRRTRKKSASEVSPAVVWVGKRWWWRRPSPFPSPPIGSLR